jgi:tetratricopeptide (TPR) repeat protein
MLPLLLTLAWAPAPLPPAVLRGFDHIFNLEYPAARQIFEAEARHSPNDPQLRNFIAQAILYQSMYKAGALESELVSGANAFLRRERMNPTPEEQAGFDGAIAQAFRLAQAKPATAATQYSQAVSHALRANYNFLVRKAWYDALKDFTAARRFAQQAIATDPDYVDAYVIIGLHDYIVGSLPWGYKVLGFLAGIRGDRQGGIAALQMVASRGVNNRWDAQVLLAAIFRRERQAEKAVPLLEGLISAFPRNYLFRLELAQMLADQGDRPRALATLDEIDALRKQKAAGFSGLSREKLAYFRGNLLFWFDEYSRAVEELSLAAAARHELDLNTALMACMRLGQSYDLMRMHREAQTAYQLAMELAPGSEIARECQRYLTRPYNRKPTA